MVVLRRPEALFGGAWRGGSAAVPFVAAAVAEGSGAYRAYLLWELLRWSGWGAAASLDSLRRRGSFWSYSRLTGLFASGSWCEG